MSSRIVQKPVPSSMDVKVNVTFLLFFPLEQQHLCSSLKSTYVTTLQMIN